MGSALSSICCEPVEKKEGKSKQSATQPTVIRVDPLPHRTVPLGGHLRVHSLGPAETFSSMSPSSRKDKVSINEFSLRCVAHPPHTRFSAEAGLAECI